MWLFFLTIALLIMYYYRSSLRVIAKNMKVNGVEIEGLEEFEKQYPHICADVKTNLVRFNKLYQKTFDFDNGDTALSEVSYVCADRLFSTCFNPFASFQIDRQGNMDGHCDYKFYTGATFSGRMRHGERFVLSALH